MITLEENEFVIGKSYVFSVPPGWLISGTVVRLTADAVYLDDAAYLESASDGGTNVGDVPLATTAAGQLRACQQSHQLANGTRIRLEAILMAFPCAIDTKALSRRNAANAIKKVR
jgi:hypothetical protein